MTTFRSKIAHIGSLLLVADKWNDPTAEEWMEGQMRAQVASCEAAGEDSEAMNWTETLASVLSDQGKRLR